MAKKDLDRVGLTSAEPFEAKIKEEQLGDLIATVYFDEEKQTFYVGLRKGLTGQLSVQDADALIAVFTDAISKAKVQ